MKILYITDIHLKGFNPRNRTDNYCDAIKAKIVESLDVAKKQKVSMILCGGDVFDSELVSNRLSDWFIDVVEEYNIPFYITVGNHDELYNNWELSGSTTLAHIFRRSKIIKQLGEYEDDEVYIKGQEYYVGVEEVYNKSFPQHNCKNKYTIFVPHIMLVDVPVWFTTCVHYENVKTNFNVVLASHNHKQWGIKEANGTKFVAPGSIARCKADECDIGRVPSVVIIDTIKDKISIIELKSAKPVEEIFDLEKIALEKENKDKLELFTQGLKNVKIQTMKVIDVVLGICKNSNTEESIVDELKNRISLCEGEDNGE